MKNKETYSPTKRFPEFYHDNWISCHLSDIGQVLNGLSGKTAEDFGKGYLYVTYKQVFNGNTINLNECERVKISPNEKQNKLFSGDILVTITSETREDIGSVSIIDLPQILTVYLNSFCIIYRLTDKIQTPPAFILQLLQTTHLRQQIKNIAQGFIRVNISRINFLDLNIRIPSQKHECIKIAKCLSVIDTQIELQRKKIEALKKHKHSLMQQLFPQRGQKKPSLRFSQFNKSGNWMQVHGEDLFDNISVKAGKIQLPLLAISQEHGAIPRNDINYNVIVSDESVANYKIVTKGDFIISLRSFQGGIEYSEYDGLCSPAYVVLRKKLKLDNYFYKYYFKTSPFVHELNKNLEGIRDGKIISYSQFSELHIPMPTLIEEQKAISSVFRTIDQLLELNNVKLQCLIDHKRGLMQQLFPNN